MLASGPAVSMAGSEAPQDGAPIRIRARSAGWPVQEDFAKRLEADVQIREAFRTNRNQLLAWPSPQLAGVASLKALALNVPVVKVALEVWGAVNDFPKSIAIDWLKKEAHACFDLNRCDVHSPSPLIYRYTACTRCSTLV